MPWEHGTEVPAYQSLSQTWRFPFGSTLCSGSHITPPVSHAVQRQARTAQRSTVQCGAVQRSVGGSAAGADLVVDLTGLIVALADILERGKQRSRQAGA